MHSKDKKSLVDLSEKILKHWRSYSDSEAEIFHETRENGKIVPHNTITPITRINSDGEYEIDVVLRNNRTTEEFPRGLFHPHPELHHIKKENIGLIEVMGLAILPGRLESEIEQITRYLMGDAKMEQLDTLDESHPLYKHKKWIKEMKDLPISGTRKEVMEKIRNEIGKRFTRVLEDAGVYKNTSKGKEAFHKFMVSCGFNIK
jgi:UDPglucose--hexose-1-phosphate uridylyltransferase